MRRKKTRTKTRERGRRKRLMVRAIGAANGQQAKQERRTGLAKDCPYKRFYPYKRLSSKKRTTIAVRESYSSAPIMSLVTSAGGTDCVPRKKKKYL
jgi:hypothetical protein